ncbi:SDR family NAD(P)-dependent oxidoreductase [Pseudoteredinibacter isoporae]|uniref:NAD(P)-dependent dehydrogenase (Short-subunit alcohol dehydrogenase family) n=1 Tax=Pseudoteredinibacter isoporae TaxID=570281 RepID=A0A7X0JTJ6_9GAMM|nr:SDR family NAD(P)-dependent oxidoreductase [Pseudoteredinibacter isoporae]MBB6521141.1 NAD(P)-dependent dehydrogenase (short-subunit alcohol dehydrogenase family) [Pseudoteredinibacter isoporae]NHO86702.1 SDR family NAD(P)-dependent oxidoreductase [Pseudoteredinibacter isoporae]NIB24846.1 SDR family NAD(P)-dependent oxidoreductase [Pseudoteredinibacter isoporae]
MPLFLVRALTLLTIVFLSAVANSSFAKEHSKRAILVTGASSGIGHQIALTLSQNGYFVYAGARKERDILALSKLPNIQGIRLDVTKDEDIDSALKRIKSAGRGLYGLVNNAGVFVYDPLIEISEEDMAFVNDVNVMGPYRVSKAFAPLIIESEGRISTIGSISGLFAGQLFGPYSMSKHAMEAYSEALAKEMEKFDVQVSVVEPGNFRSNIMKNMEKRLKSIDQGDRKTQYRDEIARLVSFVNTDRSHHASPEPVANAVLEFMSSEKPKFRYLVTPNKQEADYAIKRSLQKVVELNQDHEFSLSNEALLEMLRSLLGKAEK